ncbi:hypothetical protein BT69DRAFT_1284205 [Atractiella rhizophila]|nr:hypothetical protein BT69DRAFT_1284205 [Atractiella rhizophila]
MGCGFPLVTISVICILFISFRRLSPRLPSLSFSLNTSRIRLPTAPSEPLAQAEDEDSEASETSDHDDELPTSGRPVPSKAKRLLGIVPNQNGGRGNERDKALKVGGTLASAFWGRRKGGRSVGGIKLTEGEPGN